MTADAAIVARVLDWIGQSMDRIPHFYLLLGIAAGLLIAAVVIRELGKAVREWRRKP